MPKLSVINREGIRRTIEAEEGLSVMEIIRNNGIDELLALCGGCCSCGTCHVYIDREYLEVLPPLGDIEDDLLDGSNRRESTSRLACQIPFSSELNGLTVKIVADD
ncbi:2Fe-2S ferredoxin [Paraburkholderia sp. BL23I1N1]|uniref:2Fe-2S iron-sulfur cluster-binding protein n=1 Tax=Paraburkholderia sp. BL23I1N1 TaxID=1938802 RepID=UPI000E73AFA7|nr:2Fe-2S iron-sulfur cluster-binding protein [Paraburkholderia sp. BL23I1N1]RKE38676.1 2Fe-2S ferredoxin [Paraburkholderia sp. BL23I1N1]